MQSIVTHIQKISCLVNNHIWLLNILIGHLHSSIEIVYNFEKFDHIISSMVILYISWIVHNSIDIFTIRSLQDHFMLTTFHQFMKIWNYNRIMSLWHVKKNVNSYSKLEQSFLKKEWRGWNIRCVYLTMWMWALGGVHNSPFEIALKKPLEVLFYGTS